MKKSFMKMLTLGITLLSFGHHKNPKRGLAFGYHKEAELRDLEAGISQELL